LPAREAFRFKIEILKMNTTHILSTLVLLLIVWGIMRRKQPKKHLWIMITAFAVDVALVVYIEISLHAVGTVFSGPELLLWFHILVSVLVLAAYIFQLQIGWKLIRGIATSRLTHIWVGVAFCVLRLTNYVTSFYI